MSAVVDFPAAPETRPYLDAFRPAAEPAWLAGQRRRSLARFAEEGFPSRRGEAWRYLDLRALAEEPLLPAGAMGAMGVRPAGLSGEAAPAALLDELELPGVRHRLVLSDGRFRPELSAMADLPAGVWLRSTATAIASRPELVRAAFELSGSEGSGRDRDQPFAALNGAFFTDGFVLELAPGTVLEQPIAIVHLASGGVAGSLHTRSLVVLGEGSRIRLCESYAGNGRYWRNDVLAVRLGAGARLDRATLVEEAENAMHLALLGADLGARARFENFVLLLGGRTVRCEANIRSAGEGALCGLYGGFVATGQQQHNIVTTVDHLAVRGETREIFKGVAAERAHGAFQGRITVHPGAQKIDAHMLSRNLTLGAHAAIDTKPELEIYADDVKCSHGAAVGDLDEAAVFYLSARGIPRREARRMLIEAFLRETVETIEPGPLREHFLARLARRLRVLEDGA
jgi:Fe-S cluster assembly protein SufD